MTTVRLLMTSEQIESKLIELQEKNSSLLEMFSDEQWVNLDTLKTLIEKHTRTGAPFIDKVELLKEIEQIIKEENVVAVSNRRSEQ